MSKSQATWILEHLRCSRIHMWWNKTWSCKSVSNSDYKHWIFTHCAYKSLSKQLFQAAHVGAKYTRWWDKQAPDNHIWGFPLVRLWEIVSVHCFYFCFHWTRCDLSRYDRSIRWTRCDISRYIRCDTSRYIRDIYAIYAISMLHKLGCTEHPRMLTADQYCVIKDKHRKHIHVWASQVVTLSCQSLSPGSCWLQSTWSSNSMTGMVALSQSDNAHAISKCSTQNFWCFRIFVPFSPLWEGKVSRFHSCSLKTFLATLGLSAQPQLLQPTFLVKFPIHNAGVTHSDSSIHFLRASASETLAVSQSCKITWASESLGFLPLQQFGQRHAFPQGLLVSSSVNFTAALKAANVAADQAAEYQTCEVGAQGLSSKKNEKKIRCCWNEGMTLFTYYL